MFKAYADVMASSLVVEAETYKELVEKCTEKVKELRYYTNGVNGNLGESYTKDLIWPEIKWEIHKL